eukprot:7463620-Alexandrium_andersonii.AAC.1
MHRIVGESGLGPTDDRGQKLRGFAQDYDMAFLNTFGRKELRDRVTFIPHMPGQPPQQLDYLMVPQQTLTWSNASINPVLGFSTDHLPLHGVVAYGARGR